LLTVVGNEEQDEGAYDCIKLLHKYYFGEKTNYRGSISCTADCSR